MSCDVSKGLNSLPCKNTTAGVRKLYIANWDDYELVTGTASAQEITDLGSLAEVFEYNIKNDGNSWVETSEGDRNNGTTVWNQSLTAIITKVSKEKAFQLKMMAFGLTLVFVETSNGNIQVLGVEDGCEVQTTATVEGAKAGANNYSVVFTAMESEPAYFLNDSAKTALKALVSEQTIED